MSRWSSAFALLLAALALAFPLMVNAYWLSVGVLAMFYAIVAASWALLAGYAGQFSFGHMAFVSLGAYTSGLLVMTFGIPIPLGMAAGVLMCAIVGSGIGFVCLRMRGPYLALFTVAFSEVLRIVIVSENEVTGGSGGLEVTPLFHGATDMPYYYLGLALLGGSLAIMQLLVTPRWGLFFRAIRENEDAAAAAGVKVVRFRILAFAITSSFAGLAGGFYGHYIGILTPDIGSVDQMGLVVAMAVIGGAESIIAAMIGAWRVGRTFQITQLFSRMSVLENMLVPGLARPHSHWTEATRTARRHLEFLGLAALETLRAKNLSGGQQKLLELGRALMLDPEILFLDEPFAGVNPFLRDQIIELVRKLHADGRTFVIVDHDIEALQRLVQRMVVMSRGKKIADGTVAEVREDQEVLRAYAGV